MSINYDVYGAPETWQDCYYAGGLTTTIATLLKATRAKIPNWNETNPTWTFSAGQLRAGIADGKLIYHEPIDNSICTIGMDPETSPFKSFAVWGNYPDTHTYMIGTADLGAQGAANSIFWFEANCVSSGFTGVYGNNAFSRWRLPLESLDKRTYAPDGVHGTTDSTQNGNFFIAPFTEFGARAFILQIVVYVQNSTTHQPPYSSEPAGTWRTLDDWKNNYSDHTISCCQLRYRYLSSYTQNTGKMNYYSANWDSGQYRKAAAAFADEFTVKIDAGDNYEFYDYGIQSPGTNVGAIRIFGDIDGLYQWSGSTQVIGLVPWFVNNYIQVTTNYQIIFPIIPYSDDFYDTLLSVAAHFGVPFTPGKNTGSDASYCSFSDDFLDDDLYLPIIDENGITHGEYTHGLANADNSYYDFSKSSDTGYDPSKPPTPIDPNTYSDTTNWNTVNFQNTFCKRYELTAAQVGQLATELWSAQASKPADIDYHNFAIDEYLTNNPIDTIVSLKYFPCDVETAANPAIVHLGKYQTNIAANGISHTVKIIDYPPIDVFPHFGDFRDYEPYTTLQMYIPFCGTVSIPTAEAMGKWVSVKLCIDINTGACAGYVIVSSNGSGGICVATATGTASIDIPVSGLQSANLSQAIFNATANWTQTQISNAKISSGLMSHAGGLLGNISKGLNKQGALSTSGLLGALTGGPVGALKMAENLDPYKAYLSGLETDIESSKADYQLSHIELPMRLIGSTSPVLSSVIESSCRLIIYRPITDESALVEYADTVGFATLSSGTVSQFHGYTEGTIDVRGINATATEKSEIQRLFAGGVYL